MNLHESFIAGVLRTSAWKSADLDVVLDKETEVIEESAEEVDESEEVATHVCPLCETELEEELSDQCLLEHAQSMLSLFDEVEAQLNEEDDESDEELEDEEDEDEE